MLDELLTEIRACRICEPFLPLGPRPVLRANEKAKVAVIGQAPGTAVHASGIPWDDPSGRRLRSWLDVSDADFYNEELFAITPMGFCYPGKGKSGDLPPRKECAPLWHKSLFDLLPSIELTLLIGKYAMDYYQPNSAKSTLTERVKKQFQESNHSFFLLPHPSPRNGIWLKKHQWFEQEQIPVLQQRVKEIFA